MHVHTHYDNLKISRDLDSAGIRRAYKKLCQKYHPDKHGGQQSTEFLVIRQAYDVLSDPARRAKHDQWIARAEAEQASRKNAIRHRSDKISSSALKAFHQLQADAARKERLAFYRFFEAQVTSAKRQLEQSRMARNHPDEHRNCGKSKVPAGGMLTSIRPLAQYRLQGVALIGALMLLCPSILKDAEPTSSLFVDERLIHLHPQYHFKNERIGRSPTSFEHTSEWKSKNVF